MILRWFIILKEQYKLHGLRTRLTHLNSNLLNCCLRYNSQHDQLRRSCLHGRLVWITTRCQPALPTRLMDLHPSSLLQSHWWRYLQGQKHRKRYPFLRPSLRHHRHWPLPRHHRPMLRVLLWRGHQDPQLPRDLDRLRDFLSCIPMWLDAVPLVPHPWQPDRWNPLC